jgi:hypothetical protein
MLGSVVLPWRTIVFLGGQTDEALDAGFFPAVSVAVLGEVFFEVVF